MTRFTLDWKIVSNHLHGWTLVRVCPQNVLHQCGKWKAWPRNGIETVGFCSLVCVSRLYGWQYAVWPPKTQCMYFWNLTCPEGEREKACPRADALSASWSCTQLQAPCSEQESCDWQRSEEHDQPDTASWGEDWEWCESDQLQAPEGMSCGARVDLFRRE